MSGSIKLRDVLGHLERIKTELRTARKDTEAQKSIVRGQEGRIRELEADNVTMAQEREAIGWVLIRVARALNHAEGTPLDEHAAIILSEKERWESEFQKETRARSAAEACAEALEKERGQRQAAHEGQVYSLNNQIARIMRQRDELKVSERPNAEVIFDLGFETGLGKRNDNDQRCQKLIEQRDKARAELASSKLRFGTEGAEDLTVLLTDVKDGFEEWTQGDWKVDGVPTRNVYLRVCEYLAALSRPIDGGKKL